MVKGSTKSNDERLFDPNISTYLLNPQNCKVHQLIYDMFRNVIRNFLSHISMFLKDDFSRQVQLISIQTLESRIIIGELFLIDLCCCYLSLINYFPAHLELQ